MRLALALTAVLWLAGCTSPGPDSRSLAASADPIRWSGRTAVERDGAVRFGYPGVSAHIAISGGTLSVTAASTSDASTLAVQIDGGEPRRFKLTPEPTRYRLAEDDGEAHSVTLTHQSETWRGIVTLEQFALRGGEFREPPPAPEKKLMVIGDSVTCGEGVYQPDTDYHCENNPRQSDALHSYGMRLGERLNAETQLVCYGGRGLIRSWNGRTDELQAPQFFRLAIPVEGGPRADLDAFIPDLIVISLGTNDFNLDIGPLPDREAYVGAYVDFVQRLLAHYPDTEIALTEGAIVNDRADPARPQKSRLRDYLNDTAARLNSPQVQVVHSHHYPGDDCDAHPTGAQHQKMAQELANQLTDLIAK